MWPLLRTTEAAARRVARLIDAIDYDPLDGPGTLTVNEVLATVALGPSQLYKLSEQPKSNGGIRVIRAPVQPLHTIQRRLLKLLYKFHASEIAHGFVPKRSIVTNALAHSQARSAISLDLKDAFHSTSFHANFLVGKEVKNHLPFYQQLGVDGIMLTIIADLVDYKVSDCEYFLAQGAPTSPHIFNLICGIKLDRALHELALKVGGVATRYADNITFSMPKSRIDPPLRNAVIRTIEESTSMALNKRKTHLQEDVNKHAHPLVILGIHLMDGMPSIPPTLIRKFRLRLYQAGSVGDWRVRNGIYAYANLVYGDLPHQLAGVYEKAHERSRSS